MAIYWIFASAPVMGGTSDSEATFEATTGELADLERKLSALVEKGRLREFDIREIIDGTVVIDGERQDVGDGSIAEKNMGLTSGGVLKWVKGLK